jgi:phosphate acetyltransferase
VPTTWPGSGSSCCQYEQVARSIYITALEPGTGKSAVVLGLAELLSRRAGRIGFFRPLIASEQITDPDIALIRDRYRLPQSYAQSYAATGDDLHTLRNHDQYDVLFKRILTGYRALAAGVDALIIDGTDFSQASRAVEADLNIDIANHLDSAVLLVVGGRGRNTAEVLDAVRLALATLIERGCTVLGTVCNRVDPADAEEVERQLLQVEGVGLGFVLPELAMLAAPTVAEVATALSARYLHPRAASTRPAGADEALVRREVSRVIVGAMSLPSFLERVGQDDLLITPGDRADLIAGCLAAHLSGTYPSIAGVVLTGGLVSEPIRRLIDGFGGAGVPVIEVDTDTYSTTTAVGQIRGAITTSSPGKIAAVLRLFEKHVDARALLAGMDVSRPARVTPLMFEHDLTERARAAHRHIVLPEGNDDRILLAAEQLRRGGERHNGAGAIVELTVLGVESEVRARAAALGLELPGVRFVDPETSPWLEQFAEKYFTLRRHKGITPELAHDTMLDGSYFGTMMVRQGLADGMVSGALHTTAHTIRPAFEFIRTAPGMSVVSSVFLMCLADRVLVYGDCAVLPNPDAAQLAEVAISAAGTATMFGIEPRIAMLSYSTGQSGSGADVDRVREATALARARRPDLLIEGPIQYDAAIDPEVARTKMPDSAVAGQATVFVFPDLNTGNNTYKAVQRSANAVAIGPVLQGLAKPVNDLSRGARVADIVNTVAITAIQAEAIHAAGTATADRAGSGRTAGVS